jgi:hypothetical protein
MITFIPHMKKGFILTLMAMLFSLLTNAQVKEPEPQLSYRLQPGDSLFLEIDLQQNTHSESMDSEEISFYSLTRVDLRVDSLSPGGQIHMSARYGQLMISMLAPQLDMDISSSSGKNQLLTEMVRQLEQDCFRVVISPAGELLELEGLQDIFSQLESRTESDTTQQQVILNTLEEAFGQDAFSSLFNLFLWIYPVIPPMTNWTNDMIYYFNTKPVKMLNRYFLTKTTTEMVVIQGMGMLNADKEFKENTGMGEVKSAVSGSQTYDFQVYRENGWLKRCISRQRTVIETIILKSDYLPVGLKIPSYTETVFEVHGGMLSKEGEKKKKRP